MWRLLSGSAPAALSTPQDGVRFRAPAAAGGASCLPLCPRCTWRRDGEGARSPSPAPLPRRAGQAPARCPGPFCSARMAVPTRQLATPPPHPPRPVPLAAGLLGTPPQAPLMGTFGCGPTTDTVVPRQPVGPWTGGRDVDTLLLGPRGSSRHVPPPILPTPAERLGWPSGGNSRHPRTFGDTFQKWRRVGLSLRANRIPAGGARAPRPEARPRWGPWAVPSSPHTAQPARPALFLGAGRDPCHRDRQLGRCI